MVLGVPNDFELALTTSPYYRSTYVFVSRQDRELAIRSFDDPRLHQLKVGVHLIGDDCTNTPPAHALASRKIIDDVVGYIVYGDYSRYSPGQDHHHRRRWRGRCGDCLGAIGRLFR